ncbi:MAG: peptide chain release factor N(5)-glutamine methyltransferase [Pseudomonadota bacterium]
MPTAAELLAAAGAQDRLSAERLLAHRLGRPRSWLYAHGEKPVPAAAAEGLRGDLTRLRQGEPLAYLLGSWEFYSLPLKVTTDTLVPRPETELLVEAVLDLTESTWDGTLVDLGTGSGAIAVAVAAHRPAAKITAVDISGPALAVARENFDRHGCSRIETLQGSWWEPLGDRLFDVVVSNPPYVMPGDPRMTTRGEPELALLGGSDGLEAYRQLAEGLPQHLHRGGSLLLEHGLDQRQVLSELFAPGFEHLDTIDDHAGHPRVIRALGYRGAVS